MLSFHMFARTACPERIRRGESRRAKLQSGRSPDLSLRPRARSWPRLQNSIGFQTLTSSPQPRTTPSSFLFNPLQTLFSPRRTTALNNPFGIMRFRTPASRHRTTALNNPFGFKWFRTLSRHNGGIRVFAKIFLKNHLRFPFLSLPASAILRSFCALTPFLVALALNIGGGGSHLVRCYRLHYLFASFPRGKSVGLSGGVAAISSSSG
jgi:hypothetical protein